MFSLLAQAFVTKLRLPSLVVLDMKALLSATALQLAIPPVFPRLHLLITDFILLVIS